VEATKGVGELIVNLQSVPQPPLSPPQQPLPQPDSSPSPTPSPRKLSNAPLKHSNGHSHVHPHSFNHSCPSHVHHHASASRSMPTQLAHYAPARGGGDSTAPIDVPGRQHTRKVSADGCCENADDGRFGSWQMMEMSLNDKTPSVGSFYDPTLVSPRSKRAHCSSDTADDSISDSSSSRDFEHLSEPSTSWENEGLFPHEQDGSPNRQVGGTRDTKNGSEQGTIGPPAVGATPLIELDKATRRAHLLAQLGEMGIAYYKQCCLPHQLQANNNWMSQGLWRLLPRFV